MDIIATIRELSAIPGVSGDEDSVREAILALVRDYCECRTDALGNLLCFKKGRTVPKNRLLLSAHMDEVGFVVTFIEDSGLLRLAAVGGIDSRVAVGKAVEIGEKRLYGVIGTKAVHLQEQKEKEEAPPLDRLYIDIGARTGEAAAAAVSPGDRAVFSAPFQSLGEDKLMGRALDDRAGCALLVALIRSELDYDCHFAFTVQEETGCTGGATAGYAVMPDIAVAVETTTASDIAGVPPDKVVCRLGGGPVLSFMDKGAVYDRALYGRALRLAGECGIPAQSKQGVYGGNESRSLQAAGEGARVMAVSLPCRYLHSPSCVIAESDVAHTEKLLRRLIGAVADA